MTRLAQITTGLLLFAAAAFPQASTRQQAEDAFERAKAATVPAQKEALLKQSLSLSKSFAAYYALGNLQLDARRYAEARQTYQDGMAVADGVDAQAAAQFKIGLTCEGEGNLLEGISWLQGSLSRVENPTVRDELKRLRLAAAGRIQPMPAIVRALSAAKDAGGPNKVDLQVNFELDKSDLTASGRQQAEELGKLLESMNGYQLLFVGHTDESGTDDHNQKLSQDRADSVKRYITERFSIVSARIHTEGHGRREPLYHGVSDDNNRLNRRVEVRLVQR
jgi:outer membrane protein OmpA-like peptidoglycan-associated protein